MKRILVKTLIVCLVVFVLPCFLTLLFTHIGSSSIDTTDITIYYEVNGSKETLSFDKYLMGVVAACMSANYEMEALKAQSVIARTYALYNIAVLTAQQPGKSSFITSELGLSYIGLDALKDYWSSDSYANYFSKLENAVYSTQDEVITYDNELILPVFFNTGSGFTRNASEAWGVTVPYLVSVSSKQDVTSTNYLSIEEYNITDLIAVLSAYYSDLSLSEENFFNEVTITKRDSAGYVIAVNLNGLDAPGEEFAAVLGLSSNHFYIEDYEGKARIICNGSGHGLGLSQYGANAMAQENTSYKDILTYYYSGTKLKNLSH